MKVLGRDPVFVVEVTAAALLALSLFLNFSTDVQALVNAAVMAVAGVVSAWAVAAEKAVPLLMGAGRAVLALIAGLGVDIPANVQAGVFAVISVVTMVIVRDRVVAPVPLAANGRHDMTTPPITRTTGGHV